MTGGAFDRRSGLPDSGTFTPAGSMTGAHYLHTATLLPDESVLIAGGNDGSEILSSAEPYQT
ncbi:MAG TPA: hypothetical protein VIK32_15625 [Candidatus Limnocylindrales bacterium]